MLRNSLFSGLGLLLLAGCGGGGGGTALPDGNKVDVAGFTSYVTNHNGRNRVTRSLTDPSNSADAAVLAAFDAGQGPSGYKDLIALNNTKMTIEVIAEVSGSGGSEKATRVLRLTTDQIPLENVQNGKLVAASGKYYFRGQSFAWATIDGGPLLTGYHESGLENMVIDFGAGTASLDIRTEVNAATGSEVEIGLSAVNLPFNVITGAYGGDVTIAVRNPDISETYNIDGTLRGNVGGSPTYSNGVHGMTTSGLYTATGTSDGKQIIVDGAFIGADPNATAK